MLWTDGEFITSTDISRIDSQIIQVSAAENITIDGDTGTIRSAVDEAANELIRKVIAYGGYLNTGDLSGNHLAAVLNVGIGNSVRQKIVLQQVVVSGTTPKEISFIKQWAMFNVLRSFYRDAMSRTTDDRYKNKLDFYSSELLFKLNQGLINLGVPVVVRPLSRPAALGDWNTGSWDSSNVTLVVGPGTSTLDFSVFITYVDMSQRNLYISPTQVNNAESAGSDVQIVTPTTGHVISIDINSLNPPTGQQHLSQVMLCVISPLKATHWNVYVGKVGKTAFLQNTVPIPIDTKTFVLPGDPILSGTICDGNGQYADRRLSLFQVRQRG